jgi:pSer/pThr/pTyr-binding forkhead associated (FHA) protein
MAFLYRINTDGSQAERWALDDKPFVLGRSKTVDASIRDRALSQSHFLITREGADFVLVDLNSRNGTWLNGKRVSAHKLKPADIINAGRSLFCFADSTDPARAGPTIAALAAAS